MRCDSVEGPRAIALGLLVCACAVPPAADAGTDLPDGGDVTIKRCIRASTCDYGTCDGACQFTCDSQATCSGTCGERCQADCDGTAATCSYVVGPESHLSCASATCHFVCKGNCTVDLYTNAAGTLTCEGACTVNTFQPAAGGPFEISCTGSTATDAGCR